ncbi:hypothetical protein TSAR_007720 [Trichomalopsis sarcophagae]|uniref:Uncharacterized protein n=1 Tax=Trichomalopsis sarcophagae TaxID=543379 RepID=A0A232EST8_9HYME|nr:hypothetical protein TSAR_007720 [Trichomalopsis sarcophagae]
MHTYKRASIFFALEIRRCCCFFSVELEREFCNFNLIFASSLSRRANSDKSPPLSVQCRSREHKRAIVFSSHEVAAQIEKHRATASKDRSRRHHQRVIIIIFATCVFLRRVERKEMKECVRAIHSRKKSKGRRTALRNERNKARSISLNQRLHFFKISFSTNASPR